MAEFLIPVLLIVALAGLLIAIGYDETKLRKEDEEEPIVSPFEAHQERVRAARARAERRQIERERERL